MSNNINNYILSYNLFNQINNINVNQQIELIILEDITTGPLPVANLTVETINTSSIGSITINTNIDLAINNNQSYEIIMDKVDIGNNNIINFESNIITLGFHSNIEIEGNNAIIIGTTSNNIIQYDNSLLIGSIKGNIIQYNSAISIGDRNEIDNQGNNTISIGYMTAEVEQSDNSIAIGVLSGYLHQGANSIAIGYGTASNMQGNNCVALGYLTAENNQGDFSIAMGSEAARYNQGSNSIALGQFSANLYQGSESIAIGSYSGSIYQGNSCIAIGHHSGEYNQKDTAISIGDYSGYMFQGNGIAIGSYSGYMFQGNDSIAIGPYSGYMFQSNGIAIGEYSGYRFQGNDTIAIGSYSGNLYQGNAAIAIGINSGYINQKDFSIAIGANAGYSNIGFYSIAIGAESGYENMSDNSIIINASGTRIDVNVGAERCYINPIRNETRVANLRWNSTTSEITFNPALSDQRIKKNITPIDDNESLNILSNIDVYKYQYIDEEKTDSYVYGFLAQQVEQYVPYAVTHQNGYLPNIYRECIGTVMPDKVLKIQLNNHELLIGNKIKIIKKDTGHTFESIVTILINDNTFYTQPLNNLYYGVGTILNLFVYGNYTENLLGLNKDYLYCINFSATQQILKRIEQLENEFKLLLETYNIS